MKLQIASGRLLANHSSFFATDVVGKTRRKMPEGAAELLDMIRISSIETVEAIVRWRAAMVNTCPPTCSFYNYKRVALSILGVHCPFHWLAQSLPALLLSLYDMTGSS